MGVATRGMALLACLCVASACGAANATSASSTGKPVPLTIYAAEGYDTTVAKAFEKATGVPTTVYDDHTGVVLAKVEAEKANPKWGLLWIDGGMAMAHLDQQGMLLKGFEPNAPFTGVGKSFIPADKSYVPTGFTIAATIRYNSKAMPQPPAAWTDLLQARYKGKLGILNPAIDGPAYPLVAGWANQFGGVSKMEGFLTQLKANGAHLYTAPKDELNALKAGTVDVIFAQSSYGYGVHGKIPYVKLAYPKYVTPVPSVIGIDAKTSPEEQKEAERFVKFVLSGPGQKAMQAGDPTGDSLYWPVIQGVKPRPGVPAASTIPTQSLNVYTWGAKEAAINQWFTTHIAE